ncbi:MAG: HAMP domain-containing histidine kinase [Lachnospiraceae bacterium]|nr:HAMP domain-containing histidine kinase [Lachnospiraceae bacterium]
MIRKLQLRVVALSMSALLIVLVVIITGINVLNYRLVVKDADEILMILSENDGYFPPETPYETRYFYVCMDVTDGSILQVDTGMIASVNSAEAAEFAERVVEKQENKGFLGEYRFIQNTAGDTNRIIFLDCHEELELFTDFMAVSIWISLAGYVVVLVAVIFFSHRIVQPLSKSYEKQKRFVMDAGHELKTPLTIIKADTDVLELEIGENEWLEDIKRQTDRLADLTKDLIYLTKMEEEQGVSKKQIFSISDVVTEGTNSFQSLAQTQKKEFLLNIAPMLTMRGDERSIGQLVAILLDNALKYSPEGGCVHVSLEKQNRFIRLDVFNPTQMPLPKEDIEVVFERFYRVDASRSSLISGYGIGLSIAKAIVTAHGGKIQAGTQDGHSLLITVMLPAENKKTDL